jgi:long-chain acyl-CoA synthetase
MKKLERYRPVGLGYYYLPSGTTGNPKERYTHTYYHECVQADNNNFAIYGYMIDEMMLTCHSCLYLILMSANAVSFKPELRSTIAYAEKPQTVVADLHIFKPTVFCSVPRIFERIYMAIRDIASATPEGKAAFERPWI